MQHYRELTGNVALANTEFVVTLECAGDEVLISEIWLRTPGTGSIGRPFDVALADELFIEVNGEHVKLYDHLVDQVLPYAVSSEAT